MALKQQPVLPPAGDWHSRSVEETLKTLHASLGGLTSADVDIRRRQYGSNVLVRTRQRSNLAIFVSQFINPLVFILIFAAVVSFFFRAPADAWIVIFIIMFNGVVGFLQERRAGEAMGRLRDLTPQTARVLRNGVERELPADELVVGDVVQLEVGSLIPADGRICEAINLKMNEAVFTGEAAPSWKRVEPLAPGTDVSERRNLAWRGTTVASGRGLLLVTAVGSSTRFGQIVQEVSGIGTQRTPFQKKIAEFARRLAVVIIMLSVGVLILGVLRGEAFERSLLLSISLVVSLIPEGLPVVITLTFAWGMWQMAKRRALIRKLYAVETLGSVTVIATDKTGTLTFGEMMVEQIDADGRTIMVTGEGYRRTGDFFIGERRVSLIEDPVFRKLIEVGVLNNDSRMTHDDKDHERWLGDPTEVSLIVLGEKAGVKHVDIDLALPRVGEFPFDFDLKYMVTFHTTSNGRTLIAVKGAPRQILDLCTKKLTSNGVVPFTKDDQDAVRTAFERMAEDTLRGLCMAYAEVDDRWDALNREQLKDHLIYLGLVGIRDTVRAEARMTIAAARDAGIRVIMLTGDYRITAVNVAQGIGILTGPDNEESVIDGKELATMADSELRSKLNTVSVFSRVTPEQKLRIARALKANGEIVAMTGDGINDVPALTEANIGVAIGESSTDAAKEASEMVVTDGNLSSIVAAVEEGRAIFRNIQKVLIFLLASNLGGLVLIMITMLFGLPLPLLPIHIMWLNVITDPFIGIALAREPKGPDIMHEPPRSPSAAVIDSGKWARIALNGTAIGFSTLAVFLVMLTHGRSEREVYAVTLTTMALCEWAVAFSCRSSRRSIVSRLLVNKYILPVMGVVLLMQLAVLYLPFLTESFKTTHLSITDWLFSLAGAAFVIAVEEVRKMFVRRRPHAARAT